MSGLKRWLAAMVFALTSQGASAFVITGTLDMDPRHPALDNNFDINVSIAVSGNTAQWTVGLVSDQSSAFIGEFYFNVGPGNYSFSGFDPVSWGVFSPATPVGGGNWGLTNFGYEARNTIPGNTNRVYAGDTLIFTMINNAGDFTEDDFYDASCSSTTAFSGCWQLGAHIQGFDNLPPGSLFLVGNFSSTPPNGVPLPGTLLLLGAALIGLGVTTARRR